MNYEDLYGRLSNLYIDQNSQPKIISIMGTNGTRKSQLLRRLYDEISSKYLPVLFLWPGRQLDLHSAYHHNASELKFPQLGNDVDAIVNKMYNYLVCPQSRSPEMHALTGLTIGSFIAFIAREMAALDEKIDERHRFALQEWYRSGCISKPPDPEQSTVSKLNAFVKNTLGYECFLQRNNNPSVLNRVELMMRKDDITFHASELSHGERQVLLILPLLIHTNPGKVLVIVDEPELHLNELRAITIWDSIEKHLPEAHFVYATHSVAFGTRANTDKTYVIMSEGSVKELTHEDVLPGDIVQNIVGARIQILKSDKAPVFCEDGMHELILKELLKNDDVFVIPLGNYGAVCDAVNSQSSWKKYRSTNNRYCGVIDRDMRTDEDIFSLSKRKIVCFPYNEAESIYLDEQFYLWMMSTYDKSNFLLDHETYLKIFKQSAKDQKSLCLNRLASYLVDRNQCKIRFNFDDSNLKCEVVEPFNLKLKFEQRAQAMIASITSGDAQEILRSFKGKALYGAFANLLRKDYGISLPPSPEDKFRELKRTEGFAEIIASLPWLQDFRRGIILNLE